MAGVSRAAAIGASAAYAIWIGVLASWRVLGEPGVVSMLHDWSIFPFAAQHVTYASALFDGWFNNGLGAPVVYPTEYPLRFALAAGGAAHLDGEVLSKSIVFGVPALSFAAAVWAARACGLSWPGAWVSGLFYATSPVILNKLVAGQTSYLIGFACLPLTIVAADAALRTRRAPLGGIALGGAIALAGIQLQLGFVAAFVAAAFVAFSPGAPGRKLALLAIAAVCALVIEGPTIFGAMMGSGAIERQAQFALPTTRFIGDSVSWTDALRLVGYVTHYDVRSVASWSDGWNAAAWGIVATVIGGIVVAPRRLRGVLLAVAAGLLIVVTGEHSPIGGVLREVFARVRFAQAFRELYHLMAGVALAYALALGAFVHGAGALRRGAWIGASVAVLVAAYGFPMLTGDASGWLRAFPLAADLRPAFVREDRGAGRVAWLPMDEPLSFDGEGSGVDPAGQTSRGSLWQYSLEWPLTALDTMVRVGDGASLDAEMRALGVQTVVTRSRFASQLDRFTIDPPDAADLFSAPIDLAPRLGAGIHLSPTTIGYDTHLRRFGTWQAARFAVVPERLRAIAPVLDGGVAPFAFDGVPDTDMPFDLYLDPDDRAAESLLAAGAFHPLAAAESDARNGFAPASSWWWYRRAYADAPLALLTFGRHALEIDSAEGGDLVAVIAWVETGGGGRVRIESQGVRRIVDTNGTPGAWASAAIPLEPGTRHVRVQTVDADGEVALRAAQIVPASALARGGAILAGLERRARRTYALAPSAAGPMRGVRQGAGTDLGSLRATSEYRLDVAVAGGSHGTLIVDDAYRRRLAFRAVAPAAGHVLLRFDGTRRAAYLRTHGVRITHWRLSESTIPWGLDRATLRRGERSREPARSKDALTVTSISFAKGFTVSGARAHLPTALGSNAFVVRRAMQRSTMTSTVRPVFHALFLVGCTMLFASLASAAALGRELLALSDRTALESNVVRSP